MNIIEKKETINLMWERKISRSSTTKNKGSENETIYHAYITSLPDSILKYFRKRCSDDDFKICFYRDSERNNRLLLTYDSDTIMTNKYTAKVTKTKEVNRFNIPLKVYEEHYSKKIVFYMFSDKRDKYNNHFEIAVAFL